MNHIAALIPSVRRWCPFIVIALAAFGAYFSGLSGDFVWDDSMNISSNTFVHDWKNFPLIFTRRYLTSPDELRFIGQQMIGAGEASYRPVVTMSYFLDYAVWKLNPFGYHFTSLMIHIFCGWLVYVFLGYFIRHRIALLAAALMFVVHPVQVEAVLVPSMREDLLAAFFYLATVILYLRFFHQQKYRGGAVYGLIMAAYALALFSKEMAITLPVMLWALDVFFKKEKLQWQMFFRRRYWGFYAVTIFYLFVWKLIMGRPDGFSAVYPGGSFYTNVLNMIKVMGVYARWLVMPWTVTPTLPTGPDFIVTSFWSPHVAESLIIILGVVLLVSLMSRKMSGISLAAVWFAVALLPVMNIIPLQNIYAARFLYLPMIGVAMGFGLLIEGVFEKRFFIRLNHDFLIVCLGVMGVFYATVIYLQHFRWKSEVAFRMAMVQDYSLHMSARVGLADVYRNQLRNPSLAIEQFLVAKTINPSYLQNFIDLAGEYTKIGDDVSVIRVFREAVDLHPRNKGLRDMLCAAEGNAGRLTDAAECFKKIIEMDPDYLKSYGDLQKCYLLLDRPRDAAVIGLQALAHVVTVKKDRLKK